MKKDQETRMKGDGGRGVSSSHVVSNQVEKKKIKKPAAGQFENNAHPITTANVAHASPRAPHSAITVTAIKADAALCNVARAVRGGRSLQSPSSDPAANGLEPLHLLCNIKERRAVRTN